MDSLSETYVRQKYLTYILCGYFVKSDFWTMPRRVILSCVTLLLSGVLLSTKADGSDEEIKPPDWRKTINSIRSGIHRIDKYLNMALDLIGGSDGQCQFTCGDGSSDIRYTPVPRPNYRPPPPNGCGSPLFGFQFDVGIPSMTRCCNEHDRCYDSCGREKSDCDEQFQLCLENICQNLQMTLGLSQSVQACESAVTVLFDTVMHLGCKPYLDSQRSACICHYEEKPDL